VKKMESRTNSNKRKLCKGVIPLIFRSSHRSGIILSAG